MVSNTWGYIGNWYSDSVGTVTVTDEGSEWNNSGSLHVGGSGEGTLNIEGGGTVNVDRDTWVAKEAGPSDVINFDNGTLNTGGLVSSPSNLQGTGTINTHGLVSDVNLIFDRPSSLSQSWVLNDPGQNITLNLEVDGTGSIGAGYKGTATLQIAGGVAVESLMGYLGHGAGSNGTAFVVGEGSKWNNSEDLIVGEHGTGTLNIEAGGVVSSSMGYIGGHQNYPYGASDSVGTVTVTGEGSEWNNSSNLTVGNQGTGTLNITNEGTVNVGGNTWVANYAGSSGVINLDNGTLNTDGLFSSLDNLRGTGTINTHNLVSDIDLIFDHPFSFVQSWALDGPGQNISLNLHLVTTFPETGSLGVGHSDSATMQITGGAYVQSRDGFLGYQAGSSGTAFVVGEGSEWNNTGSLYVGRFGNGTLNIEAGGVVSSLMGYIGGHQNYPYGASDSVGTVTVTGEGSEWNNSGWLEVGGYEGEGTLNITEGGVVRNSSGYIGSQEGSVGTVTVSGEGSEWNNSEGLTVGDAGNGTLNIMAGRCGF